jgi:hypothetical protein
MLLVGTNYKRKDDAVNNEDLDQNLNKDSNRPTKNREDFIKSLFKPPALVDESDEVFTNDKVDESDSKWNQNEKLPEFIPYNVRAIASVPSHAGPGRNYPMEWPTMIGEIFTVFETEQRGKITWGRVSDTRWVILNFTRREH